MTKHAKQSAIDNVFQKFIGIDDSSRFWCCNNNASVGHGEEIDDVIRTTGAKVYDDDITIELLDLLNKFNFLKMFEAN